MRVDKGGCGIIAVEPPNSFAGDGSSPGESPMRRVAMLAIVIGALLAAPYLAAIALMLIALMTPYGKFMPMGLGGVYDVYWPFCVLGITFIVVGWILALLRLPSGRIVTIRPVAVRMALAAILSPLVVWSGFQAGYWYEPSRMPLAIIVAIACLHGLWQCFVARTTTLRRLFVIITVLCVVFGGIYRPIGMGWLAVFYVGVGAHQLARVAMVPNVRSKVLFAGLGALAALQLGGLLWACHRGAKHFDLVAPAALALVACCLIIRSRLVGATDCQ